MTQDMYNRSQSQVKSRWLPTRRAPTPCPLEVVNHLAIFSQGSYMGLSWGCEIQLSRSSISANLLRQAHTQTRQATEKLAEREDELVDGELALAAVSCATIFDAFDCSWTVLTSVLLAEVWNKCLSLCKRFRPLSVRTPNSIQPY